MTRYFWKIDADELDSLKLVTEASVRSDMMEMVTPEPAILKMISIQLARNRPFFRDAMPKILSGT